MIRTYFPNIIIYTTSFPSSKPSTFLLLEKAEPNQNVTGDEEFHGFLLQCKVNEG